MIDRLKKERHAGWKEKVKREPAPVRINTKSDSALSPCCTLTKAPTELRCSEIRRSRYRHLFARGV